MAGSVEGSSVRMGRRRRMLPARNVGQTAQGLGFVCDECNCNEAITTGLRPWFSED